MIDLKPTILQALEGNSALISLLGGTRIYQLRAPDATEFPRVTFFQVTSYDGSYADDQSWQNILLFQIDVWSKGNNQPIVNEIDKTMKSLSFKRTSAMEMFEDDTLIYHTALRYLTQRFEEV